MSRRWIHLDPLPDLALVQALEDLRGFDDVDAISERGVVLREVQVGGDDMREAFQVFNLLVALAERQVFASFEAPYLPKLISDADVQIITTYHIVNTTLSNIRPFSSLSMLANTSQSREDHRGTVKVEGSPPEQPNQPKTTPERSDQAKPTPGHSESTPTKAKSAKTTPKQTNTPAGSREQLI